MKIMGIQLNEVEAKKLKTGNYTGMDVNLNIESVNLLKDGIAIDFFHSISYSPTIGFIRFYGRVLLKDEATAMKKVVRDWKKKKELPTKLSNAIVNLITSTACLNGVFISRTINLPAPVFPINVQLKK